MSTKQHIKIQFELLCELMGKATTEDQAIAENKEYWYELDFNRHYGGYRIDQRNFKNTGKAGAFGFSSMQARKSAKEFYSFLCDTCTVLTYLQNNR